MATGRRYTVKSRNGEAETRGSVIVEETNNVDVVDERTSDWMQVRIDVIDEKIRALQAEKSDFVTRKAALDVEAAKVTLRP